MQKYRFFSKYGFFIPFPELFRYAIVGLILNFLGYLLYLAVTALWLSPFVTITIFYPMSVIAAYFSHRRYTFREQKQGLEGSQFIRFVALYVFGFFLNWSMLFVFFEKLGYPHQLVQFGSIFIIAGFLFISMKLFVFPALQDIESRAE